MSRVLLIVGLVAAMMATGVATASIDQVRLPVTVNQEPTDEPAADTGPETGADSVVVVKGDHLWKISAQHVGAEAGNSEVAPYWREVVDVNTPQLRSGDPDLIYPGEVVELPAVNGQP